MHSEDDVGAFTAELNKDIEGSCSTSQQPSHSDGATLSKGSSFQTSMRNKHVPYGELLRIIQRHLDKDRAMQIGTLHKKIRNNEITRGDFVRHAKSIVGKALYKLKTQVSTNSQQAANQFKSQPQVSSTGANPSSQVPKNLTDRTRESSIKKKELVNQSNERNSAQLFSAQGLSSLSHTKQGNANSQSSMDEFFEMHSSRVGFTPPASTSKSWMPSLTSSIGHPKAPPTKPLVGQKKPMEELCSSLPLSSKKQKVSEPFDQLNDVIVVCGLNLSEEEGRLFSGPKEDSRISELSRRVVQEEEKLFLQKIPLQKKVVEIMAKSGLKSMGNDMERCLSLCAEERMRGLIADLVKLSKQRVDMGKPRHRTFVTSDIRQQIVTINLTAREELEKKPAETELESGATGSGDKEKDKTRLKSAKGNKEKDDQMHATAANNRIRAATGGGDMVSKWLSEAPLKHGGIDTSSVSQPAKESHLAEKGDPFNTPASVRKVGRNQVVRRVARSITRKDVIAVLEREPQMSNSILIYRLYDKVTTDASQTKY